MTYKSLWQQIKELWASKGLEVIEEKFECVARNTFKWTITAKRVRKQHENRPMEKC